MTATVCVEGPWEQIYRLISFDRLMIVVSFMVPACTAFFKH